MKIFPLILPLFISLIVSGCVIKSERERKLEEIISRLERRNALLEQKLELWGMKQCPLWEFGYEQSD